jgi:hypothetical protein
MFLKKYSNHWYIAMHDGTFINKSIPGRNERNQLWVNKIFSSNEI